MELLSLLFAGHLVGDFLLQTAWMVENKHKGWVPLLVHSLLYTLVVASFALLAGGISFCAMVAIFISHVFIDRTIFVDLWLKYVSRSPDIAWLRLVQDQIWHFLILVGVAFLQI